MGLAAASAPAQAASSTPACSFNNGTLPIVTGVTYGSQVNIQCTGLPPLHPYLLMEISLVIGIDPAASGLLSGNAASLSGLESALSALGLLNLGSVALPFSDLNGNLNFTYTVPSSQALDPNASCPPTPQEFNSGLIGCALAMVDLTTLKAVGAGSAVLEWQGDPFLPPSPGVSITPKRTHIGQTETVSDVPNASTYWWVSTLGSLEALLGGSTTGDKVTVVMGKNLTPASSDITTTPASYVSAPLDFPGTFTPPSIQGTFVVPSGIKLGKEKATVVDSMASPVFPLVMNAKETLRVVRG
jgi:hypothetical protein